MNGFITYFENNKKNMSFLADDDDDVIWKYNKIFMMKDILKPE